MAGDGRDVVDLAHQYVCRHGRVPAQLAPFFVISLFVLLGISMNTLTLFCDVKIINPFPLQGYLNRSKQRDVLCNEYKHRY